jgi:hypothetical protein
MDFIISHVASYTIFIYTRVFDPVRDAEGRAWEEELNCGL